MVLLTNELGTFRYTANRQYGRALPYFLRLRRPNVFDLIREHNLFTDVQDQVLLLVQFDDELNRQKKCEGQIPDEGRSDAITLLVDNIHSIPVSLSSYWIKLRLFSSYSVDRTSCAAAGQQPLLSISLS